MIGFIKRRRGSFGRCRMIFNVMLVFIIDMIVFIEFIRLFRRLSVMYDDYVE